MFLNHWYKDILRNINRQWEVGLLVAYGKEYAPGKGGVLLSSLSHHLQKSLGARVFLQKWLRLSHFLTAYYSKCSYAFNKMVIFCHSSALVNVLFLWGNAQHLSVIPVSYIMTKYHILTFCYAQWGEIINQHSWKLMRLSWKAPWRKGNPATIKTGKMLNTVIVFFFFCLNNYTYMPKDMWWSECILLEPLQP